MANKIRFVTVNPVDNAYLTCTSTIDIAGKSPYELEDLNKAVSTLPVTNLKNISKSKVFKSEDATPTSINMSFNDSFNLNCVILNGHNLTEGVTINLYFYSDQNYSTQVGTETYVLTALDSVNNFTGQSNLPIWFSAVNEVRSARIFLTNSGTDPITYFQISKLFVSTYFETAINISLGNSIISKDTSKQYRTEGGSLITEYGETIKEFSFKLDAIKELQRLNLQRILADVGMEKSMFISVYPEGTTQKKYDYLGTVKQTKVPKQTEFAQNIYKSSYVFEEI